MAQRGVSLVAVKTVCLEGHCICSFLSTSRLLLWIQELRHRWECELAFLNHLAVLSHSYRWAVTGMPVKTLSCCCSLLQWGKEVTACTGQCCCELSLSTWCAWNLFQVSLVRNAHCSQCLQVERFGPPEPQWKYWMLVHWWCSSQDPWPTV